MRMYITRGFPSNCISMVVLGSNKILPCVENTERSRLSITYIRVDMGRLGIGWVQAQRKFMGRMKEVQGIHYKYREPDTGLKNVGKLTKEVKLRGGYQEEMGIKNSGIGITWSRTHV